MELISKNFKGIYLNIYFFYISTHINFILEKHKCLELIALNNREIHLHLWIFIVK